MLQLPEIDRDSRMPPYQQVAWVLIERVRRGEYQPGDRLPGLHDLVEAAGIARLTARKALRFVAERGYAELSPGMGYYVPADIPDATGMRPDGGGTGRTEVD